MAPKRKKKTRKKAQARKKSKSAKGSQRKKAAKKKVVRRRKKRLVRRRGRASGAELVSYEMPGLGAESGGQSGDTQGISGTAGANAESVKELLEEGQSYEAEVLNGVENAPDADESEVVTREVAEDDVPDEYRETRD
ncbi:MAG TPA: hypothetical protein VF758_01325 [Candidatus Acidoferrum sp.]